MNIISTIVSAWASVMTGIVELFEPAQALFWTESGLTFLGSMALIGVSVSVCLLIVGIIQRFLHLRG